MEAKFAVEDNISEVANYSPRVYNEIEKVKGDYQTYGLCINDSGGEWTRWKRVAAMAMETCKMNLKADQTYIIAEKKVLIYGAGDKGGRVLEVLKSENVSVEAFIDKRAQAYDGFRGLPVRSWEFLYDVEKKDEYVVIITVKNAYAHNEIAVQLKKIGFNNQIFMPLYVLKGGKDNEVLNTIMHANTDLTDEYRLTSEEISSIEHVDLSLLPRQNTFMEVFEGKVKTCIPAELLHMPQVFRNVWCIEEKLLSYNMFVSYYAVYMYEEFARGCVDENAEGLGAYLTEAEATSRRNGMPVDQAWKDNFISGKLMVFQSMRSQLALHPEFFRENCAEVSFGTPSHFRVKGTGKNRISFLLSQGYQFIPVNMSQEDYNRYWNEEALRELRDIMGGTRPDFPISHPAFFEQYSGAEDFRQLWLIPIARKILEILRTRLAGKHVSEIVCLDRSDDWGITSRFLSLLGFRVERQDALPITEALDRLFYVSPEAWTCAGNNIDIFLYSNRSEKGGDSTDEAWGEIPAGASVCFIQCWSGKEDILQTLYQQGFSVSSRLFSTYWQERPVTGYCLEKK